MRYEGKFIRFVPVAISAEAKTKKWIVVNKDTVEKIGEIKWFGRWRGYAFFPDSDTVYEKVCLRDIANFLKKQTKEHYLILKMMKGEKNGKKRETE